MPSEYQRHSQSDILQPVDYQIFALAQNDVNIFADYYLRSPSSGTKIERNGKTNKREEWDVLYGLWVDAGRPNKSIEYQGIELKILWDADGYPIFWHHHGWLFQDWQKEAYHCNQPELTIIGGFGSGKTAWLAATHAVLAAITPNYRGFCVAPQMMQVLESYKYIMQQFRETPWMTRWVTNVTKKPPVITLENDFIGESTIEFLSIERDPEKVRTLEADFITLDQAEKIEELDELVRDLGSRLRGQIAGRPKLGKLVLVANAGNNPQLWQRYDMAQWEPDIYKSFNPGSWDNQYLSETDIANLKRRVSGSAGLNDAEINQWMGGQRPMGAGRHFSISTIQKCTSIELDNLMNANLETQKSTTVVDGNYEWVKLTAPRVGVYKWEAPPDHRAGRQYIVVGDPGQSNPPDRNSPPIMVWDVTNFPAKPATLRAFHWVFAAGSYWGFLTEFERYVKTYRAHGRCAFDSTGTQKGFDELAFALMGLQAEGMNMSMSNKYLALNSLKLFMENGLMQFPYISHLQNQLSNYELPDSKLRQDLVMCMAMSALWMRRLYYMDTIEDESEDVTRSVEERYDRYDRTARDRHERGTEIPSGRAGPNWKIPYVG